MTTPSQFPAKSPSESVTESISLVMPGDANPLGTIFGGRVMAWIDEVAALAAQRHSRRFTVTLSMDALEFKAPILVGEYAVLKAWVNRAWTTSLEVEVSVEAEHPLTGERRHSAEAFLTFVAIGNDGRPTPVPPVAPQSPEEWGRYEGAQVRREARLAARAKAEAHAGESQASGPSSAGQSSGGADQGSGQSSGGAAPSSGETAGNGNPGTGGAPGVAAPGPGETVGNGNPGAGGDQSNPAPNSGEPPGQSG